MYHHVHHSIEILIHPSAQLILSTVDRVIFYKTPELQIHRFTDHLSKNESQTCHKQQIHLIKDCFTSVHRSDLSQPIESETDRSFASQHKSSTSKAYQSLHEDVLSKTNIWSLGKHKSSLSKQQTPSGMGKDGLTDAASLVPEVKVMTELSDYSTPPKRRKIRKGEDYF